MNVTIWSLGHSRESFLLTRRVAPTWALAVSRGSEFLLAVTGHLLCCRQPDVVWKIPMGRPKRDRDGWLENSLGSAMYSLSSWLMCTDLRASADERTITLTDEQARLLDEEWWCEMHKFFDEENPV